MDGQKTTFTEGFNGVSSAAEVLPNRFTAVQPVKKTKTTLGSVLYMAKPATPEEEKKHFNIKPKNLWYEVILHFKDEARYHNMIQRLFKEGKNALLSERYLVCRNLAYRDEHAYGYVYSVRFLSPADMFFRQFLSKEERRQLIRLQKQRRGPNSPVKSPKEELIQRKRALWSMEDRAMKAEDVLRDKGLFASLHD